MAAPYGTETILGKNKEPPSHPAPGTVADLDTAKASTEAITIALTRLRPLLMQKRALDCSST